MLKTDQLETFSTAIKVCFSPTKLDRPYYTFSSPDQTTNHIDYVNQYEQLDGMIRHI